MHQIKVSRGVYERGVVRLTDPVPDIEEQTESIVLFIPGRESEDRSAADVPGLISVEQLGELMRNDGVEPAPAPFSRSTSKFFSLAPVRLGKDASQSVDAIVASEVG